jgi:hypothetical protein
MAGLFKLFQSVLAGQIYPLTEPKFCGKMRVSNISTGKVGAPMSERAVCASKSSGAFYPEIDVLKKTRTWLEAKDSDLEKNIAFAFCLVSVTYFLTQFIRLVF